MKKLFFSAVMCVIALTASAQYVDLGLPSGTKWKAANEPGFYSYMQAKEIFGSSIPSKTQWEELIDYCSWEWTGRGYKVIGPNSRSIFFPVDGMWYCDGRDTYKGKGEYGACYTSTVDVTSELIYGWVCGFAKDQAPFLFDTDDFPKKAYSTRLVLK